MNPLLANNIDSRGVLIALLQLHTRSIAPYNNHICLTLDIFDDPSASLHTDQIGIAL